MASVLDLPAEGFDRRKPLFRLFEMENGTLVWFEVFQENNAPGRPLSPQCEAGLWRLVAKATWRQGFWEAFAQHRKATVYEDS